MQIKEGLDEEYKAYVEKNSKDGYSKGVITFSERWAFLMENKLDEIAEDIDLKVKPSMAIFMNLHAKDLSHEADTDPNGLTGFMYGCSVQGLAKFWIHGEELRKWHNGEYGVKDSKGVVNPAVLVLKPKGD